eukprot:3346010-Amphidinium_carterae.11
MDTRTHTHSYTRVKRAGWAQPKQAKLPEPSLRGNCGCLGQQFRCFRLEATKTTMLGGVRKVQRG